MKSPLRFVLGLLAVLVPLGALAAFALAANATSGKLPDGARIGGLDVGGLTKAQARAKLDAAIGEPASRGVRVTVGDRDFTLSAQRAGVTLDLARAIGRAYAAGQDGSMIERGWRELTGGSVDVDLPVQVTADRKRIRSFVGQIHSAVARKAVDAELRLTATSVSVSESRPGRRLAGREDLVARIAKSLTRHDGRRVFSARVVDVQPAVDREALFERTPTVVTVSRADKVVRVFRKGELVKRYRVAVGEPKYPTPVGRFAVQSKQVNPVWNVPDSEWAGDLRGQTIPGGDPRNPLIARWIGFNGSVGFHGTKSVSSLGTAASHGCVRMSKSDVIDLFDRVEVGTPVLVAA